MNRTPNHEPDTTLDQRCSDLLDLAEVIRRQAETVAAQFGTGGGVEEAMGCLAELVRQCCEVQADLVSLLDVRARAGLPRSSQCDSLLTRARETLAGALSVVHGAERQATDGLLRLTAQLEAVNRGRRGQSAYRSNSQRG